MIGFYRNSNINIRIADKRICLLYHGISALPRQLVAYLSAKSLRGRI